MIVCVSITEQLHRNVFVKIPDGASAEDAVSFIRDKYDSGDIILDADDFVGHSDEINKVYTETNDRFVGGVDYEIT